MQQTVFVTCPDKQIHKQQQQQQQQTHKVQQTFKHQHETATRNVNSNNKKNISNNSNSRNVVNVKNSFHFVGLPNVDDLQSLKYLFHVADLVRLAAQLVGQDELLLVELTRGLPLVHSQVLRDRLLVVVAASTTRLRV